LWNKGWDAYEDGSYTQAVTAFLRALRLVPTVVWSPLVGPRSVGIVTLTTIGAALGDRPAQWARRIRWAALGATPHAPTERRREQWERDS
jgi:hypothetical protein